MKSRAFARRDPSGTFTHRRARHARRRHTALGCLLAGGALLAVGACQKENDDDGALGGGGSSASAGSAGRAGSGTIPTAGSSGSSASGSGGGAGAPEMPPEQGCVELEGLEQCGGASVEAELKIINLLIVIDKSGSMVDEPEGFDTDKWSAMKDALEAVLETVNERVHVGLALYPYSPLVPIPYDDCGQDCCTVPSGDGAVVVNVAPPAESGPLILSKLDETEPGGGTPTAKALAGAYDYFTSGAGSALEGAKYVLLATDGGPNCNPDLSCDIDECTPNLDGTCGDDENCCDGAGEYCVDDAEVTDRIEALAAAGISTFVVGIPGTDDYADYLDAFALAGGVPDTGGERDYFAVSASAGVGGLVDVFTDITTDLVTSCEIALETKPQVLDAVNVAVDCQVVPKEGDDGSGWDYDTTPDPSYVILKGPACEELQENGASRIDVVYGCPTVR